MSTQDKIAFFGQNLVTDYLKETGVKYWTNNDKNYNITDVIVQDGDKLLFLEVNTKPYYTPKDIGGCWTGKNTRQIEHYIKRSERFGVDYYMVWVDALKGCAYGKRLSYLIECETLRIYPKGEDITLFKLDDMEVLFDLKEPQRDYLIRLARINRGNEQQKELF